MLIKAGYGVFHFNDPHRLYPTLMDVVCCNRIGLVKILLSAGANPDISGTTVTGFKFKYHKKTYLFDKYNLRIGSTVV